MYQTDQRKLKPRQINQKIKKDWINEGTKNRHCWLVSSEELLLQLLLFLSALSLGLRWERMMVVYLVRVMRWEKISSDCHGFMRWFQRHAKSVWWEKVGICCHASYANTIIPRIACLSESVSPPPTQVIIPRPLFYGRKRSLIYPSGLVSFRYLGSILSSLDNNLN